MAYEWFSDCLEFSGPPGRSVFRLQRLDSQTPITLCRADGPSGEFKEVDALGSSYSIPVLAALAVDRFRGGDGKKAIQFHDIVFLGAPFDTPERIIIKDRKCANRVYQEIGRLRGLLGPNVIGNIRKGYQLLVPVKRPPPFTRNVDASRMLQQSCPDIREAQISGIQNASNGRPDTTSTLDPYASVPPLPPYYFDRPEIFAPLREVLLGCESALGLAAIAGMGGVGKTVMALALCHDPVIRERFRDGIVWLPIGKEPTKTVTDLLHKVGEHLGQPLRSDSVTAYRDVLGSRAVLVVLDNVWSVDWVEPFLLPAGRSKVLYTSRDTSIAPLWAEIHQIGALTKADGRLFLERLANSGKAIPEPAGSGILDECKGLMLALAMLAGALRNQREDEWRRLLDVLRNANLKMIRARPIGYDYETLHAAIGIGVTALDDDTKRKYLKLAVLLEGMVAPSEVLTVLWGCQSDRILRIVRELSDRSLVRRDPDGIRLHDLQLDYIRGEHEDRKSLALQTAALLRSYHVVRRLPQEFASQMIGRLLAHVDHPGIVSFLTELQTNAPRPFLRPVWPCLDSGSGPSYRVLEGHSEPLSAVAVSDDAKRIISSAYEDHFLFWNLDGVEPVRTFKAHEGLVTALALSPDGKRAISGGSDKIVRIWELETAEPPLVLEGHEDHISSVALSADGRYATSLSQDGMVLIWDLRVSEFPGFLKRTLEGNSHYKLSTDGRHAISVRGENTLLIWDLDAHRAPRGPRVLDSHARVRSVALSATGKYAVSGSDDGTVLIWNLDGNQASRVLKGHNDRVSAVAINADGTRAVSAGTCESAILVWDLTGFRPPRALGGTDWSGQKLAISADGKWAVSGSSDNAVMVWDLQRDQTSRVIEGHRAEVLAASISANGKRAVTGSVDGTMLVWDLDGRQSPLVLTSHAAAVTAVALSADGKRLASGSWGCTIQMWDLVESESRASLKVQGQCNITAIALSVDAKRVAFVCDRKTVVAWNSDGLEPPATLGEGFEVGSVALSADGKRVYASGSWPLGPETDVPIPTFSGVRAWNIASGQPTDVGGDHHCEYEVVALTATGTRALCWLEARVTLWDLGSPQPLRVFEFVYVELHTGRSFFRALLSDDGNRAIFRFGRTIVLVDLINDEYLGSFTCESPVTACAWAANRLIVCDEAGNVHFLVLEG